jgi:hypothetical protein
MDAIWNLPGPIRFAKVARSGLEQGSSVLVGLPGTLSGDAVFQHGLRRAIDVHFDLIDTTAAEDRPVASIVAEQMGIDDIPPGPEAIALLARHPMMAGRRLALHLAGKPEDTGPWMRFIRSFLAAARPIPTAERPLLLIVGGYDSGAELLGTDLTALWWWGVVNRVDTACHLQDLFPGQDGNELLRDTITEVVGYDLELASYLASEWDGDEATLAAALVGYTGPDWPSATTPSTLPHSSTPLGAPPAVLVPLWDLGLADRWDSFGVYLHACTIPGEKNRQRIWRAQIRHLMPLIDEERARIEAWMRGEVRGLRNDVLLEPRDLHEIMQDNYRLQTWRGGHRKRLVSWLRNARNTLAHMDTLPNAEIVRGKSLISADRRGG